MLFIIRSLFQFQQQRPDSDIDGVMFSRLSECQLSAPGRGKITITPPPPLCLSEAHMLCVNSVPMLFCSIISLSPLLIFRISLINLPSSNIWFNWKHIVSFALLVAAVGFSLQFDWFSAQQQSLGTDKSAKPEIKLVYSVSGRKEGVCLLRRLVTQPVSGEPLW